MSGPVYVDTNVLIYARDGRYPDKQAKAQAWLKALAASMRMTIGLQVIKEHHSVASRKFGLSPNQAAAETLKLFAWCDRGVEPADVQRALDIQLRYKTSWWDALNLACAVSADCTHFLTEDAQSAPIIEGLRIIDLFEVTPAQIGVA
jgi:predicted nucleic acid-binding protein